MRRQVTTTYLEMTQRSQLRPAPQADKHVELIRVEIPCPELNRFLYATVGARWWWYSRLTWDYARWLAYLDRPELETWVAYVKGTPAGYFELEKQEPDDVEIAYFGLLPGFIGQGLGGELLTAAVRRGWQIATRRVWVHTCDLDHPHALRNYEERGFRIYRTETNPEDLPEAPLERWPGANVSA